jgi:adenylate cyclase
MGKSYWIEFIGDRSIRIEENQSILQASLAAGIPHYHACGGKGQCSTCRVLVKEGAENLSEHSPAETILRKRIRLPKDVRLACQTFVLSSPVRLHRIIRDELDILLYTQDTEVTNQIGEEKDLALMFLDIRNFTPFMEAFLAFDVIHVLRRLFYLFRKAIHEHNGRIIETVGDGFYAVFGFSTTLAEASDNAVKAGYAILEALRNFNEEYVFLHFYCNFEVGIGIHAGRVITGNIGLGVNNNITVMGLPVNIASRLQDATKKLDNNFIISNEVASLLVKKPKAPNLDIKLKGIRETVKVYLLGTPYHHQKKIR